MMWLAGQIAVFVFFASAIGFVTGWLLRSRVKRRYPGGSPEAWAAELETELDAVHSEYQAVKRKAEAAAGLEAELVDSRARIVELESMLSGAGAPDLDRADQVPAVD